MQVRTILGATVLVVAFAVGGTERVSFADEGDVEERIAQFWQRIDAMQPGDHLSSADLGQWALNVIERDPRARLTVADFRASTAAMQAALDRAGPAPAPAADPTAAPSPTPAPTQTPTTVTFGGGTKIVGSDIQAGTYRTRTAPASCYWERSSGFSGSSSDIIANNFGSGYVVVTIAPSDAGFDSQGCGTWSADLSAVKVPDAPFGEGTFIVSTDIAPGTWRTDGGSSCYWERLSGFGGTSAEIIANNFGSGGAVVQIIATDKGFSSTGCGTWTKVN